MEWIEPATFRLVLQCCNSSSHHFKLYTLWEIFRPSETKKPIFIINIFRWIARREKSYLLCRWQIFKYAACILTTVQQNMYELKSSISYTLNLFICYAFYSLNRTSWYGYVRKANKMHILLINRFQLNYPVHSCISKFRLVLKVLCFLLGNSPASEFYIPTFRDILYFPYSYLPAYEDGTMFRNVGI